MIIAAKVATAIAWLVIISNWISPMGDFYPFLHWAGIALIAAHFVEMLVFMPNAKKAGGSLPLHAFQLLVFGYPHNMALLATLEKQADSAE